MPHPLKSAFAHYLRSCGLPFEFVFLHDDDAPVSVMVQLGTPDVEQFLRYAFRFDLAARVSQSVDTVNLVIRHNGRHAYTHEDYRSGVLELLQSERDALRDLFAEHFKAPLARMAEIRDLVDEAIEGPLPATPIREFNTPGGFTVRLSASPDPDTFFETGTAEDDWRMLEFLGEHPYLFCQLECVVLDPQDVEIGRSSLGRTTGTNGAPFRANVWKTYGRDMVREAIHDARKAYPRKPRQQMKQAA